MRQQLMPLLLFLFTAISLWSNTPYGVDNGEQKTLLSTDILLITNNVNTTNSLINSTETTLLNTLNSNAINDVFYFNLEKPLKAGISLNKEFSYNLVEANSPSSASNLYSLHINSNLFTQGLFYGFALTVILLNLVCFFIFDENLFLYFTATLAAITSLLFFAEGLFPAIGIESIVKEDIIQSTFLLVSIALGALFASKYLSLKEFYPKLNYITLPILVIATVFVSMAWIFSDLHFANLANLSLFGVISVYFIAGVLLFSRKNYAKFYVIATFIPLLFSIDFFVLQNFGIAFLFTEPFHLKIAVLFQALLLSYAILYRMQAVKEEGVLRQTEMRIFLKRQDVMNRVKVEEMIEDIYLENLIMQYDLDGLEIKLLQYISEGKSDAKIARKLKITESEVSNNTKELYKKLEISEHIQGDYRMVESQPDYIYN